MRSSRMCGEPRLGMLHNFHSAPFNSTPSGLRRWMLREIVVVVEAAVQSGGKALAVENHSTDECGSVITLFAKRFRECCVVWRKRYGKVGDAVGAGQKPGEDCRGRSIGDRAGSECLREAHPIFCECVRCGRCKLLMAKPGK